MLPRVDIISGGFPCQDISYAGPGTGIAGPRSGLWRAMVHAVRMVRPCYVVVENVAALLGRGMGRVLGDLAEGGYDAEWDCLPATAFGADHVRDRVFIIAYSSNGHNVFHGRATKSQEEVGKNASHADPTRLQMRSKAKANHADEGRIFTRAGFAKRTSIDFPRFYRSHKPVLGRGVHGVSRRVDRIRGLGNAVLPQIAEWLARRIIAART